MNNEGIKKDWEFCRRMLPLVSRTFSFNIEHLEGDIRKTVLLGYLLFRIADTFEDTIYQDEREKIVDLRDFSEVFKGDKELFQRLKLYESLKFRWKECSDEKNLIENGHRVLRCYFDLSDAYRKVIDPLIVETSAGMLEFQRRKLESGSETFQLSDMKELEEYCYYVAGVVGVMLTKIFYHKEGIRKQQSKLDKFQIHFGIALQLINIIKDYQKDIARGWCYIPQSITKEYRIEINAIETLSTKQKQGITNSVLPFIIPYLDSTLEYIKLLPLEEASIRMFCIIPFVLGYRSLSKITQMEGNKISRQEVGEILYKSNTYAQSNSLLEEDYLAVKERYLT